MKKYLFILMAIFAILFTSESVYSKSNVKEYVGTYTFTDEVGTKWKITLNDDETVLFESSKGGTYYGSFMTFPYKCPLHRFSLSECPMIYFPSGKERVGFGILSDDGYLYDSNTNFKAKHPKHRLKITKTK